VLAILDTNAFVADFHMEGTQFRLLFDSRRLIGLTLAVPQIVVSETIKKFEETMEAAVRAVDEQCRKLTRLIPGSEVKSPLSGSATADAVRDYETFLRSKLAENRVRILPYPQLSHMEVVGRDLARKKPFGGPSGYRDFLIWQSVVNAYRSTGDEVVLITQNTKDFASSDQLHDDLLSDLGAQVGTRYRMKLALGIREFNSKYVLPHVERAKATLNELTSKSGLAIDLYLWVTNNIEDILSSDDLLTQGLNLELGIGQAGSPRLFKAPALELHDAYEFPEENYIVEFTASVSVEFSVDFDWEDFQQSEEVREILGEDDDEPFSWASLNWRSEFQIELEVTANKSEVIAWDVRNVQAK
jgi:hypothetical protein